MPSFSGSLIVSSTVIEIGGDDVGFLEEGS